MVEETSIEETLVAEKTLVIIPTYNEAANLSDVVARLQLAQPKVDILIVDDNSPDGTGKIADSLIGSKLFVLHRDQKAGLGPAYLAGFNWGITRSYNFFVEMDADGSHQPEELGSLLRVASLHDLVLGTRWMPGGSVVNWPLTRRLISRFGTKYASEILNLPFRDLTSGYRVLSRQLVTDILNSDLRTLGYGFQIEIVRLAAADKLKIIEVPITFIERVAGNSKMNGKIVLEAFWMTTQWGFQRVINRR